MHDLQTIIKLNAPVNQRTPALAKANAIAATVRMSSNGASHDVPELDRVEYAPQKGTTDC